MIVADDVTLDIAGRTILDRVAFTVERGESVALVGPNGSGKTSVLRCLLGLVPFTGRLAIDGHDVVREPIAARGLVGYVPQHAAFADASARDVLAFVAKLRRIDGARIHDVLALTGLRDHAGDRVRTFSGGMRQRLALAAALLPDPPVLLFDEPTANLDRDGQALFDRLVAQLRRAGHTLLLASHRSEEVTALTDRAIALDAGRIVASRPARRVLPFPSRGEGH
jgi:ABC-type multidrug transport system ATPase subunit